MRLRSTGAGAVQAALPFTLDAPARLAGCRSAQRGAARLGQVAAALVTYGQGLGGVAVIERSEPATSDLVRGRAPAAGCGQGSVLATSSRSRRFKPAAGVTGQELDTALGSAIEFTHNGVSYLVIGSLTRARCRRLRRTAASL